MANTYQNSDFSNLEHKVPYSVVEVDIMSDNTHLLLSYEAVYRVQRQTCAKLFAPASPEVKTATYEHLPQVSNPYFVKVTSATSSHWLVHTPSADVALGPPAPRALFPAIRPRAR